MLDPGHRRSDAKYDAVIVGSGWAGLYALYRLRALGLSVLGIEAAPDVGGTWYWNRYPGARVDTNSLNYSFGFSDELQQEWHWTEKYASRDELLAYFNHVADRFDLRRTIDFNTAVVGATFDEARGIWSVRTSTGSTHECRFLVAGTGVLSATVVPDIPGLETFEGRRVHTSRWPETGVQHQGKRVGIIGTGSSGVQVTPELAKDAGHLYVFQRTANYCITSRNATTDPTEEAAVKSRYVEHRQEAWYTAGGSSPAFAPTKSALEVDEEELQGTLESAWADGAAARMMAAFKDILTDAEANERVAEFIRSKIRAVVEDPQVAELLTPRDHPFATKRPVVENGYYEAFNRPNVTLVDVRSDPIVEITPAGVRTENSQYDLDVLVLATGFDAISGSIRRLGVVGREGVRLEDKWDEGVRTYLGLATAGFPNFFFITGPGSPSVLGNVVTSIEQHVGLIADLIIKLREVGGEVIEVTQEAEDEWTAHVAAVADATLYPLVKSWYMGSNVPGKPRSFLPYVGGVGNFRRQCEEAVADDFRGFVFSQAVEVDEAEALEEVEIA